MRATIIRMVTATSQEFVSSCRNVGEVIIRDTEGNDVVRLNQAALRPYIAIHFHADRGSEEPDPVVKREKPEEPCNCCDRAGEYNGYGSGPLLFVCPKSCPCHD